MSLVPQTLGLVSVLTGVTHWFPNLAAHQSDISWFQRICIWRLAVPEYAQHKAIQL